MNTSSWPWPISLNNQVLCNLNCQHSIHETRTDVLRDTWKPCGTKIYVMPSLFMINCPSVHHRLAFCEKWPWWRYQMGIFSALLAVCAGNSPVTGEFPSQKASDAEVWCFLCSVPWINSWVNNREAGDLRRHRAHYDVIVIHCCSVNLCNHHSPRISLDHNFCTAHGMCCKQLYNHSEMHQASNFVQVVNLSWNGQFSCIEQFWGGVTKPIFSVPLFSDFFSIVKTHASFPISPFIFHRCRRNSAAGAPVKYKCDLNTLRGTFARSKILQTEKLTNGALVLPPLSQSTGSRFTAPLVYVMDHTHTHNTHTYTHTIYIYIW